MGKKKKSTKPSKNDIRKMLLQGLIDLVVSVLGAYIASKLK